MRYFQNLPVSQVVRLPPDQLPGKGDIVAIDAEFVSLMVIREWIYLCTNLVGVGGWEGGCGTDSVYLVGARISR